jgi:hypothetical protein
MELNYQKAVCQLFLHSALQKNSFEEYSFPDLLKSKLVHLYIDINEELVFFANFNAEIQSNFSRINILCQAIPEEARFGIYCNCVQLGIVVLLDDPANEFFLLLGVALNIPFDKEQELKNVFSKMLLTFFGFGS